MTRYEQVAAGMLAGKTYATIADELRLSIWTVKSYAKLARARGIKKNGQRRWTEAETALLSKLWPDAPLQDVFSAFPGRTHSSIRKAAEGRGLKRSKQVTQAAMRENGKKGNAVLRKIQASRIVKEDAGLEVQQIVVNAAVMKIGGEALAHPLQQLWRP